MAPRSIRITEKPLIKRGLDEISAKEMPRGIFYRYIFGPTMRWMFIIGVILLDFIAVPSLFISIPPYLGSYSPSLSNTPAALVYYLVVLYILVVALLILIEVKFYNTSLSREKEDDKFAQFLLEKQKGL